jgi:hypothetical protein
MADEDEYPCERIEIDERRHRLGQSFNIKHHRTQPEDYNDEYVPNLPHIPEVRVHRRKEKRDPMLRVSNILPESESIERGENPFVTKTSAKRTRKLIEYEKTLVADEANTMIERGK